MPDSGLINIIDSPAFQQFSGSDYINLGKEYFINGNNHEAYINYRKAIGYFKKQNNVTGLGKAYDNLGYFFSRTGELDSSLTYYIYSIENYEKYKNYKKLTRAHIGISYIYLSLNNVSEATLHIQKAIDLSKKYGYKNNLIEIYKLIGNYFLERKNYIKAKEYFLKCHELAESRYKCFIKENLANIELQLKNDANAETYIKEFIDCMHNENPLILARGYSILGQIYKYRKNYEKGIEIYKKTVELINKDSTYSNYNYCFILHNYGEIYESVYNYIEAEKIYNQAIEIAKEKKFNKDLSLSLFNLGRLYYRNNRFTNAEKYLIQSYSVAEKNEYIELIRVNSEMLKELYAKLEKYELAYKFSNQFLKYSKITNERIKVEDEKQLELSLMLDDYKYKTNAVIEKHKIIRNTLILFILLLFVFSFLILLNYRKKRKDNLLLAMQKSEIEKMSKKLHEADQMKLKFYTNISHELRTPLTLILDPVRKLLKQKNNDNELNKELSLIHENADKLNAVVNQILELKKLDDGKLKLNQVTDDIILFLKELVGSFEGYCNKYNCTLSFFSNHQSVIVSFDKEKTASIVSNLLSNAFKFNQNEGSVVVEVKINENLLSLSVADEGIGISEQLIEKVFERYYRIPSVDYSIDGTGIGLAYVRELIEFMQGEVNIHSKINTGTKVNIKLPVKEYEIKIDKPLKFEIKPGVFSNLQKFNQEKLDKNKENTLLIVEDHEELARYIISIFNTEYNILYAKNGIEGKELALEYIPDLIISDIIMPQMDGSAMSTFLKNDEHTSHIPILMLTAKDSNEDIITGYQSGADDYILKPFDADILKLKVDNIIYSREKLRHKFSFKGISNNNSYSEIDARFIKKCIEYINTRIDDPELSVEILAEKVGFSVRNFYRKIKCLTNKTPADFIRCYKMEYAAGLLKSKKIKVFEAAVAVGYNDTVSFTKTFKKVIGVLPSSYVS